MLDYPLEAAFVAVLKVVPVLAGVHFYTGHDGENRHTPSVTVESKSDAIAGSAVVFRSELSLVVETDANDTTPGNHTTLVQSVRDALADKSAVGVAINAGGAVKLYGYAFMSSAVAVEGSRHRTTLTLRVGYGVPLSH